MPPDNPEKLPLSPPEILRYSRHLMIPEVGMSGQKKLKQAKVLIVGAGGLGSPVALYLAAAGVGTIGIVEYDLVDQTNLQRQILYGQSDVGKPKLDVAAQRLSDINPLITIRRHPQRLSSANALKIISEYQIVVDGSDNFPTRYLVNDACALLKKINVYGSIYRFSGQVSVFDALRGPCYRCLYPQPPPPELVPSCAEGGVIGIMPGIIGSLQGLEVIKLILEAGDPLIGRLLIFDALRGSFDQFLLRKNAACPLCGENPGIRELIDYQAFCGVSETPAGTSAAAGDDISPEELHSRLQRGDSLLILDVREEAEYQICNLDGLLIPLRDLPGRLAEIDGSKEIVVHCHTGVRSARAAAYLRRTGFSRVRNLAGGIDAWAERIDRTMPRY